MTPRSGFPLRSSRHRGNVQAEAKSCDHFPTPVQALLRGYSENMAVFSGATLTFGILGFALVTGCGGRASSPGLDGNGNAGSPASDGGKGVVPNASDAGADAVAGAVSSDAGGAPGSAGQSSSANSAGGVAPSLAGNGAGGAAAGAVAAAGTDSGPLDVTTACTKLCSGWIYGCSIWEFPPTCPSDCSSDLAVENGACTDLGLSMLSCMTTKNGTTNNNLCYTVFIAGIAACRAEVDAFRACAAGSSGSAPQPKICMSAGAPFTGGCSENKYCLNDESYTLRCADAPGGSSCTCASVNSNTKHKSSTDWTFDEPSDKVCLNQIEACLVTANSTP